MRHGGHVSNRKDKLSMMNYYAFRLQSRYFENSTLMQGGCLLQQYIVDAYAAIKSERPAWFQRNQEKFRGETFAETKEALESGNVKGSSVGRRVILPSSFTGGPRYMKQNYQDAMAICSWSGDPDLFLTFTCNPNWKEIRDYLDIVGAREPTDRPDIIARVFNTKVKQLRDDIVNGKLFGRVVSGLCSFLTITSSIWKIIITLCSHSDILFYRYWSYRISKTWASAYSYVDYSCLRR